MDKLCNSSFSYTGSRLICLNIVNKEKYFIFKKKLLYLISMRIKIQQFLFGKSHSWSVVGQNLGRELLRQGHNVEFISTDGIDAKYVPDDLRSSLREAPTGSYDMQLSYTAPHNWPAFMSHGTKNRFCIWNYEYNSKTIDNSTRSLLQGYGKFYKSCDLVLPSSNFTKEVFKNMLIPEDKMVVVPHGINLSDFKSSDKISLRTKKKTKILLNVAQPHRRKALPLAFESFGKAFTKNDDVCFVAKVMKDNNGSSHQKEKNSFDVDFTSILKTFESKFPNHAEVECMYGYVNNISDIYKACDINFSATHAECWHLPSLEALAAGLVNVVPRYGGQLDFCNDDNSLLLDGRLTRVDRNEQYWTYNPLAVHYCVDTNDAAKKLKYAVENISMLKEKFAPSMKETVEKYTWENAAKQILDLCK